MKIISFGLDQLPSFFSFNITAIVFQKCLAETMVSEMAGGEGVFNLLFDFL